MAKGNQIPVYDICNLVNRKGASEDIIVERLEDYLADHLSTLHFPHRHSFFHIVLFTAGSGVHSIDFLQFTVQSAQIYCMVPGQVHSWNFEGNVTGYIINFSESFFKSFLVDAAYLDQFVFLNGLADDGVMQLSETDYNEVTKLMQQLLNLKHANATLKQDLIRIKLIELLITLDKNCRHQPTAITTSTQLVLLKQFRKLIETHYNTIRLPKQYAEMLYVTPNYLNAICKDTVGKTAGDIIRDRIILEAKRLLTSTGSTIAEIAYTLNFPDNSYFNRFFKKYTQQTPEVFRKQFLQH